MPDGTATSYERDPAALDAADPLAAFRDRFVFSDPGLVYLDGNSLGRLPRATVERLAAVVGEDWGGELIRGWDHWIDEPGRVGDLLATEILGARPGEVIVGGSSSPIEPTFRPTDTSSRAWHPMAPPRSPGSIRIRPTGRRPTKSLPCS